jgi:2-polyprenyl-3-methyl-5-hydroxy-6-metoxy-1,4-benzoquinol methylase
MKTLEKVLTVKDLEKFYDDLATRAGTNWQQSMYRSPHQINRFNAIVEYLKSLDLVGREVLELGSANGLMTKHISELAKHIDAVEISSVAIENSPKLDNVTYFQDDVTNFLENCTHYAVIVATEVLEHVLDFEKTLKLCFEHGDLVVVSMPISEEINPEGAFDATKHGKETRVGDATGHLRIISAEELKAKFSVVDFYWDNGISVVVAGK